MTLLKIDHINIVVTDLRVAQEFFERLGFVHVMSSELQGEQLSKVTGLPDLRARFVALELPNTETKLELIQYFSPVGGADPALSLPNQVGFRHMAFAVTDIEAEVARLREAGVALESEIQVWEKTGKKLVYFYGPDGIVLEFAEYPALES